MTDAVIGGPRSIVYDQGSAVARHAKKLGLRVIVVDGNPGSCGDWR